MKAEEKYNSLLVKEGSIEAPPSTKGVGGFAFSVAYNSTCSPNSSKRGNPLEPVFGFR
jgi:hypothetical protein